MMDAERFWGCRVCLGAVRGILIIARGEEGLALYMGRVLFGNRHNGTEYVHAEVET